MTTRSFLLDKVYNVWIKGVLENSLHGAVLIELGLEEHQEASKERTLPPNAKMSDVFGEVGENLLILGEPGSGKTTMLLELARERIDQARQDPTQPIPVVLNLSFWTDPQQPLAEWLVKELKTKYNIPQEAAQVWVKNNELLLLLDGLDEVAAKNRDACVRAINEFRQQHLIPLVVCSRTADYETLTTRLMLDSAVVIKPLTPQQINDYLDLRFVLYFSKLIPWNYARFLDYAAERILLRKAGNGYIFIHRLLLEHFATWHK